MNLEHAELFMFMGAVGLMIVIYILIQDKGIE